MATQYTPILKLALPVTGELSGTWGDTVNDNITSMVEQAVAGLATINTWVANSHTLTSADGTTSESRCAMLVADDDGGGNPSAAAEIICPAATKLYVLKNISGQQVTLKTSAGTGIAVPNNETAFLFCDGTNVNACITSIINGRVSGNLIVDGNTTLGDSSSDTITTNARFNTDLLPSTDNARDLGSSGNSWKDLYIDGTAYLALVDINGGAIDGVTLGTNSPVTNAQIDNININGNTISTTNTDGDLILTPDGTGNVNINADTVRIGDSGADATLTTNGTGDLILNTNSGTNSGSIRIQDGLNGNIVLTPDGTGEVDITKVDIAGGEIDGTTIGANSAAAGTFTSVTNSALTSTRVTYAGASGLLTDSANLTFNGTDLTVSGAVNAGSVNTTTLDLTNLEVTNIKAKDGTASATIADTTGYWSFSGTGAFVTPKGNNTTERPGTPVTGMLRYNTTSNEFEGYSGSSPAWKSVGGAAISNDTSTATDVYPAFVDATTGTASTLYTSNAKLLYKPSTGELKVTAPVASNGILVNATTMTANYTIATGTNGLSVGPFTIDSGVTLTINSGQRHLIL